MGFFRRRIPASGGGWWLPVALTLVVLTGTRPQPARAAPPASAAVVALLGPEPRNVPAYRADIARLHANGAVWAPDGLSRLLVYRRLAEDFQRLQFPDSSYRYWLLARRAAEPLRQAYPLETSALLAEMGMHHFAAFQLDSAARYLRAAADQLAGSGINLRANRLALRADGQREVPGRAAASRYANAGLVY